MSILKLLWVRFWVIILFPFVPIYWIIGRLVSVEEVRFKDWVNSFKEAWKK